MTISVRKRTNPPRAWGHGTQPLDSNRSGRSVDAEYHDAPRSGNCFRVVHSHGLRADRLAEPRGSGADRDREVATAHSRVDCSGHRAFRATSSDRRNAPANPRRMSARSRCPRSALGTLRPRFRLTVAGDLENIEYDTRCDGIFPLITNRTIQELLPMTPVGPADRIRRSRACARLGHRAAVQVAYAPIVP
jgi:hypothetical protein